MKLLRYLRRLLSRLASGIRGLVLEVKRPENALAVVFGILILGLAVGAAAIAELNAALVSKVTP